MKSALYVAAGVVCATAVIATLGFGPARGASPALSEGPALTQDAVSDATGAESATPQSRRLVALDPGHGGDEVGAAWNGVVEKHSNLDMALRVEALLIAQGFNVLVVRRTDERVSPDPNLPPVGGSPTRVDLQARIDMANAAGADVWVSIHSNGSSDRTQSGVEVWYDPNRAFGQQNLDLAWLLQRYILDELWAYGYPAVDRGIKDDACFRYRNGRCFQLYVLAERANGRGTQMPGALVEALFVSNPADNSVLADEAGRDAIARGIARAISDFLGPPGE
ncbi:MAG TPA: N-acetylmuramoyl-L-alanine amidase [Dehalococcoidia bacterium]|nr:N-acetylmuramoyl-L-alanine amidase [Dehalococcoidia bacterium]